MKIKIGDLLSLVTEEVVNTLLENTSSSDNLVICKNFNLNHAQTNLNTPSKANGIEILLRGQSIEDYFYDDAADETDQSQFVENIDLQIGQVIRELEKKFPKGKEIRITDVDRCEILGSVLSLQNIQRWNSEIRPKLQTELDQSYASRNLAAPELTDFFLHVLKKASPDRWELLLLNPKKIEDKVKEEEEKPDENVLEPAYEAAVSYFSGAKLVPGFQGLDATFFDIGREDHKQTGCARVWRKVFEEEFGTAESLGAVLGFAGLGGGIAAAHFKAAHARTAGWKMTKNPYASLGQRLKSNWKFRGLRYGFGALLYPLVAATILGGPKVAAMNAVTRKEEIARLERDIDDISEQLAAAQKEKNTVEEKKLEAQRSQKEGELSDYSGEPKEGWKKFGRGFMAGAACIFGLYQTVLLGGPVLKWFLNINDFDAAVRTAMRKQVMSSMESVFESFRRDTGKHVDEDASLFWGALYRDSKNQSIEVTDNQIFKFIEETEDGLVKFNGTQFKLFCTAFNSLDDVAKKQQILTDLGITPEAAGVLINRIKSQSRTVGVNIQKMVKAMNGNVDKHLVPLMQTLRIISKNAANSNPEFARKSLLIILQRQTKNLDAITEEIRLANASLREASEILDSPQSVNSFLDTLAPRNVFDRNRPTIGGTKDSNGQEVLEDVLENLDNFSNVFSGYARGSAIYRFQQGTLVKTGIPEIGGDFAFGSYGQTMRLLRMQLEDLAELEGQKGILRGIQNNKLALKTIEETRQSIKNLMSALKESKREMSGRLRYIAKKTEGTQEAMDDTFIRAMENDIVIDLGTDATLINRGYSFNQSPPLRISEGTSDFEILNYIRIGSNINDPLIGPEDLPRLGRAAYDKLIEIRDTKKFVFESSGRGVQTPFGIKRDGPREIGPPLSTGRLDAIPADRVIDETKRKTIKKINLNILKS